jgi:hypothetical protein
MVMDEHIPVRLSIKIILIETFLTYGTYGSSQRQTNDLIMGSTFIRLGLLTIWVCLRLQNS